MRYEFNTRSVVESSLADFFGPIVINDDGLATAHKVGLRINPITSGTVNNNALWAGFPTVLFSDPYGDQNAQLVFVARNAGQISDNGTCFFALSETNDGSNATGFQASAAITGAVAGSGLLGGGMTAFHEGSALASYATGLDISIQGTGPITDATLLTGGFSYSGLATNARGILLSDISAGSVINRAIETGLGDVYLGDSCSVPGSTGKTFEARTNTTAPSTTVVVLPTTIYGAGTALLGAPVDWVLMKVNGTERKVPVY